MESKSTLSNRKEELECLACRSGGHIDPEHRASSVPSVPALACLLRLVNHYSLRAVVSMNEKLYQLGGFSQVCSTLAVTEATLSTYSKLCCRFKNAYLAASCDLPCASILYPPQF